VAKTGQDLSRDADALEWSYTVISRTYRGQLEREICRVEQAHTRAFQRRAAFGGLDAYSAAERQACLVDRIRLETLRRQIQHTIDSIGYCGGAA
jgi:hypothetical protein